MDWLNDGSLIQLQPFDIEGKRHTEYLAYRGEYADVPIDRIMETFCREYMMNLSRNKADFDREVEA
jgi:hypothetical protein